MQRSRHSAVEVKDMSGQQGWPRRQAFSAIEMGSALQSMVLIQLPRAHYTGKKFKIQTIQQQAYLSNVSQFYVSTSVFKTGACENDKTIKAKELCNLQRPGQCRLREVSLAPLSSRPSMNLPRQPPHPAVAPSVKYYTQLSPKCFGRSIIFRF